MLYLSALAGVSVHSRIFFAQYCHTKRISWFKHPHPHRKPGPQTRENVKASWLVKAYHAEEPVHLALLHHLQLCRVPQLVVRPVAKRASDEYTYTFKEFQ